jgi:hypothetical protein
MHVGDIVSAERRIDEKFAAPKTLGMLQSQEIGLGAADSLIDSVLGLAAFSRLGENHGRTLASAKVLGKSVNSRRRFSARTNGFFDVASTP